MISNIGQFFRQAVLKNHEQNEGFVELIEQNGTISFPQESDVLRADFARDGTDLFVHTPDGQTFLVVDYFMSSAPADLKADGGGVLTAGLVAQLAGPQVAGLAQSNDVSNIVDAGESIGTVMELDGLVRATRVDGQQVTLSQGDPIFQGDIIETGIEASVGLVFADDTIFSLGTEGRMVLDEMVYDPGSQTGTFSAMIVQGAFSFVSGQVAKTSMDGMVVRTPTSTIGIRGSTVLGQAAAEGSENKITLVPDVDGNVGEIIVSNSAGTMVLNQAGATTTVFGASQAPTQVSIWDNTQIQKSYGETLTTLVKTVASKAESDASVDAHQAEKAAQQADIAKEEANTAQAEASTAQEEAQTIYDEAASAEQAAAQAKADAVLAEAEAEAAKLEALQLASAEAKAKAVAAELKALEAAAQAKMETEAAAQAELQSQQAQAVADQAQTDAQAKFDAALQAEMQASIATAQADTTAQFNTMAKAALTAQTQSTQYMITVPAAQANTATTAQKAATTSTNATTGTPTADAATPNSSAATTTGSVAATDTIPTDAVPADKTPVDSGTSGTATTDIGTTGTTSATDIFVTGTNAVIQAATLTTTATTPFIPATTIANIYTVAPAAITTTTTSSTTTSVVVDTTPTIATVSGKAIDGYISGATVFVDTNDNGIWDTGEAKTTTDATGNYTLSTNDTGSVIMSGGTDISTNQAFVGSMKAAYGATIISPLTTMISSMMDGDATLTVATAKSNLASILGLDSTIDLLTFDPVAGATSTTNATAAEAIMKAAVQIQNTIVQAASVLQGASGAMTDAAATASIFKAMASQMRSEGAGSTFLTDVTKLSSIINSAATDSGITGSQNLIDAINTVKAVITTSNAQVRDLVGGGGDLLSSLAQTSIVAQGSAATSIKAAFGNAGLLTTLNDDFNTNLSLKVTAAADKVGNTGVGNSYRSGDDLLDGTAANNVIDGRGGNDTISGFAGNDVLRGGTGNDTLNGGAGNDRLYGGTGTNTLSGGSGNDTYILTNSTDTLIENGQGGTDAVHVAATYTLAVNFENLKLLGTGNFNATGNTAVNILTGNAGNNTLDGGADADTMIGGAGNDTYLVDNTRDIITEKASEGTDTVQSSVTFTLSNNVENLSLTGTANLNGTGNTQNNTLTGNSGNNTLNGGAGNDTLIGGLGNDAYVVDSVSDIITENAGEGTDTVTSTASTYTLSANLESLILSGVANINGTGNSGNNSITGNAGNNTLSGGNAGTDSLAGGVGNDIYIIDRNTVSVSENANEGTDTVKSSLTNFTLSANVEKIILTGTGNINGTGNSLANTLTGNAGNNTLDGGTGADTMGGGAGNDTYIVDNISDTVTESLNGGTDIIQSSVTYTISNNVETLSLSGTAHINATGNSSANTLSGNSGNNVLDGKAGADSMSGGAGNDTYVVDNTGDGVSESANAGTDLVQSSITYVLGTNVENLTLTGTGAIDGTGHSGNNTLIGNTGDNVLRGAVGDDTVTGGSGNDVLFGEAGADSLDGNAGLDVLIGGAGTDKAVYANAFSTYTIATDTNRTQVMITDASGVTDILHGIENIQFSNQTVAVSSLALKGPVGTIGNDGALTGGASADVLFGGAGNDTITGSAGADHLIGDLGDDLLKGGAGNDLLIGGLGSDTAIFTDIRAHYTITIGKVAGQATVTANVGNDGVDTLVQIENLQFFDGTIALAAPAAISGNSVNIGSAAASYTGDVSAPSGSVLYGGTTMDMNILSGNTYDTGSKAAVFVDDLVTLAGTINNHGGLLSGDDHILISGNITNATTGVLAVEAGNKNINISGGTTDNFGMIGVNSDLNISGSSTVNNFGLMQSWENSVNLYGSSTTNNYGAIFASDNDAYVYGSSTLNNFGLISVPWNYFSSSRYSSNAQINNYGHILAPEYYVEIGGQGIDNHGVMVSRHSTKFYNDSTSTNDGTMIVTDYSLKMYNNASLMNRGDILITDDSVAQYNQSQLSNAGTMTIAEGNLSIYNSAHHVNTGTINLGQGIVKVYDDSVFVNGSSGIVNANMGMNVINNSQAYNAGTINLLSDDTNSSYGGLSVASYLNNSGTLELTFGTAEITGTLDNSGSLIVGEGDLNIQSTGTLNNASGGLVKVGGTLNLMGTLSNEGTVTTKAYVNTGSYSGGGTLTVDGTLDVYGALTTTVTGTVTSAATTLGSLTNNGSAFINGTLGVTGALINAGMLQTAGTITAAANVTNTSSGTFMGGGPVTTDVIISGNLVNDGTMTAAHDIKVAGTLTNSGDLLTMRYLYGGTSLTNNAGGVISADKFYNGFGGETAIVNSGEFHIGGTILNVSSLVNNAGAAISAQGSTGRSSTLFTSSSSATTRSLKVSGDVSNAGDIVLANNLEIGGTLTNLATGNINTADDIKVTGLLTNSGNIGVNYIIHGTNLLNKTGGILTSGDSTTFTGTVTNEVGAVIAVDNSLYFNGGLTNAGTLLMGNNLKIGLSGTGTHMINSGSVTLENDLSVFGNLTNQSGAAVTVGGTFFDYGNTSNAGTISIHDAHGINTTGTYTATIGSGADGTMKVENLLTLGGSLVVDKDAGYTLVDGTAITLFSSTASSVTGDFSSYVNNLASDWGLSIVRSASTLIATLKSATTTAFAGTTGAETLVASSGDDVFTGSAGNDALYGGTGTDTVDYSAGSSAVTVNLGTTTAQAIGGGMGSDTLNGIESIIGSNFDDILTLSSTGGTITGGSGADTLTGGTGNDIFRYTATTGSQIGSNDIITNFNAISTTEDIFLDGLLTGTFSWLGAHTNAFTGGIGGNNTEAHFNDTTKLLEIDTNGDGSVDMGITLTGVALANLDAADFTVI